jgi:hypothetical protein
MNEKKVASGSTRTNDPNKRNHASNIISVQIFSFDKSTEGCHPRSAKAQNTCLKQEIDAA